VTADLLSASWDPGDAGLTAVWLPGGFEVEYAEPGGREVRAGLDRLRRVDLGSCLPVRSFPSYKGQRNYPGTRGTNPTTSMPPAQPTATS